MDNLSIYNQVKECPESAKKTIGGGKLKGMTDINSMWRIKRLTELFGPSGTGWKIENVRFWTTPGAGAEVAAWCSLELRYKQEAAWSEPVLGIGGSMLVDTQKGKPTTNDDAYKMAYTDAISVACKALGMAADVYWAQDITKYNRPDPPTIRCERCGMDIRPHKAKGVVYTPEEIAENSRKAYGSVCCWSCMSALAELKRQREAERYAQEAAHENAG